MTRGPSGANEDDAPADKPVEVARAGNGIDPDAELLRRHVAGDRDAFAEILTRHRDHLWAVALRTTGDPDEAADALQDALLSAVRHAAGFRGDARVSTWLHRIVVNACLDRLRRSAVRPVVPLPDDDHTPAAPGDAYAERDLAADVHAALAELPPEQRVAIVLVDIEGYPVDDAAALLAIPAGTIKSRCSRGRARLVPLLAHLRGGNPPAGDRVEPPKAAPTEPPPSAAPQTPPGTQREDLR